MAPSIKGGASGGLENYTYMIKNGSAFKIPDRNGGSIEYVFKDSTENPFEDLTSNPTALQIFAPLSISQGDNTSSEEIAELVTKVINEGHPRYHVAPNDSNITASNEGNVVTIVISNLISAPKDLLDPDGTFDSNLFISTSPQPFSVLRQSLIQLGSAGDVPKIHKFCEEALRSYMYYKYIQRKRGVPANEKQMAKRSYYNEKRLARARMMNFNKEASMQISRKAFKQSPKI